jgi:hypothetical protein
MTSGILRLYDNFYFKDLIAETSCPVSNSNIEIEDLVIYPNPTIDVFQLKNHADISSISIFNILGRLISTSNHSTRKVHDISALRAGLYFVRIENQDGEVLKTMRLSKR